MMWIQSNRFARATMIALVAGLSVSLTLRAGAQSLPGLPQILQPTVTVSASATTSVPNDRLQAWMRAEADNVSAATAAAQVNAMVAKALADAKAFPAVKVATAGYSTQQVGDRSKPARWRASQTIVIDAGDFTAAATLISKLQDENGLLLAGTGFSLADKTRRDAEDSLTEQAIKSWQARARQAAHGFGFPGARPLHMTVQTSDAGRAYPVMRAQGAGGIAAAAAPPVALEAGTTDVSVTVSGDAILEPLATPTR
jgi:predicted secreted protein